MQMTPEQLAREKIDSLLISGGWVLQDNSEFDRTGTGAEVV